LGKEIKTAVHRDSSRFDSIEDMAFELRVVFTDRVPLASSEWCPSTEELVEILQSVPAEVILESFNGLAVFLNKENNRGSRYMPEEQQELWIMQLEREKEAHRTGRAGREMTLSQNYSAKYRH